ncbi:MAG: hypothetical protein KBT48_10900 [Firmicutes bacterium]|nr:hypothetical protein [Bacillota bacterium]
MIDMHAHILPGVDDGARSFDEALQMLKDSCEQGTRYILLTPHGYLDGFEKNPKRIVESYKKLKKMAKEANLPVQLALGMEVYAGEDFVEHLDAKTFFYMNASKYMMVEVDFHVEPDYILWVIDEMIQRGICPILAHAERYKAIQNYPGLAYRLNRAGVAIQVNKGSLFGAFGQKAKQCAHLLLEHNLVQLIASDCHGSENRRPGLKKAWDYISKNYSSGYAEVLMKMNPERVWTNKRILIINPRNPK